MSRILASFSLLTALGLTTSVFAQEPTGETPRDPQGIQGISPFWEAIVQGDAAFLAQDFASASSQYQSAITNSPKNPVGHLRMAELSLKQGELTRAQDFITAALRFASDDLRFKAQATFLLAELRERQLSFDDAIDSWRKYKAMDGQLPATPAATGKGPLPPRIYIDTADKRIASVETKKKLDADYAAVRERIKQNIEKADAATGAAAGTVSGKSAK